MIGCDFGPIDVGHATLVIEIEYNHQPAFVLYPDGRCKIDQPKLAAFANRQIESSRPDKFAETVLLARAILSAGGWTTPTLESWGHGWPQANVSVGLLSDFTENAQATGLTKLPRPETPSSRKSSR